MPPGAPSEAMTRRLLAAILLAAAFLAPASAGHAPAGGAPLQCGEFSPFRNFCDAGPYPMFYPVQLAAVLVPFVGELTLTLSGSTGGLRMTCWSLGGPPLAGCEGPFPLGSPPKPLDQVRLRCEASATRGPGLPAAVGPDGPWGCSVSFDDA